MGVTIRGKCIEETRIQAVRRGLALIKSLSGGFIVKRQRFDAHWGAEGLQTRSRRMTRVIRFAAGEGQQPSPEPKLFDSSLRRTLTSSSLPQGSDDPFGFRRTSRTQPRGLTPVCRHESLRQFTPIIRVMDACPFCHLISEDLIEEIFSPDGYNIGEMGKADKVRACYQHCCLRWVCRDYMTNATLRKRLGIDDQNYPMASRIIKDTMDQGIIRLYDPDNKSNRTRKYIPFWS